MHNVKRQREWLKTAEKLQKIFLEKIKKVLDKMLNVWYNAYSWKRWHLFLLLKVLITNKVIRKVKINLVLKGQTVIGGNKYLGVYQLEDGDIWDVEAGSSNLPTQTRGTGWLYYFQTKPYKNRYENRLYAPIAQLDRATAF